MILRRAGWIRNLMSMKSYSVKTPKWLKFIFPKEMIWDIPAEKEAAVYITFDDGPNPATTPFVLSQLEKHDAHATFFCVGNNAMRYPGVYNELLEKGHSVGNHTFDHINGWKTENDKYIKNIDRAKEYINSRLFRPPYGKMKISQMRELKQTDPSWKIIMWDILSADFDQALTGQQCLDNVLTYIRPGSIVLLHDSEKAWPRMSYALPCILEYCQKQNWKMKAINS
jgi:peptidoglycan/xylan/chitin deacetylase (PgdA/CDA1 family)